MYIWTKRQKDNSNDGPQEDSDIKNGIEIRILVYVKNPPNVEGT